MMKQMSISEIQKNHQVRFKQYLGFYIWDKESIYEEYFLETDAQDRIDSEIISAAELENLKKLTVKKVIIRYILNSQETFQSAREKLKGSFPEFSSTEQDLTLIFKDHCGNTLCKMSYSDFAIPNFTIEILPAKRNCLSN